MTPRTASVEQRSQTVGALLPEVEAKIVDPATGEERPIGERGELCTRGYHVMKGYYNNADATRAAIDADGWLHTGDEASIDPQGYFRITGRIKDLIIRSGGCVFRRGRRGGGQAQRRGVFRRGPDRLVREHACEVQGAETRQIRAGLPDDRIGEDSKIQATGGTRTET
jgi:acyl-CoA synthetase (AMP-forming)/AMP-acid ligase II